MMNKYLGALHGRDRNSFISEHTEISEAHLYR